MKDLESLLVGSEDLNSDVWRASKIDQTIQNTIDSMNILSPSSNLGASSKDFSVVDAIDTINHASKAMTANEVREIIGEEINSIERETYMGHWNRVFESFVDRFNSGNNFSKSCINQIIELSAYGADKMID